MQKDDVMDVKQCKTCLGCGLVADTKEQEPWTVWQNLPIKNAGSLLMGLIKPMPCPECAFGLVQKTLERSNNGK